MPRVFDPAFLRLWAAAALTNLGDGVLLAAAPLLVVTVTTDPAAVAVGGFLQYLPWLLFGLSSGALADRLPRHALVTGGNTVRAAVLTGLALTVAAGTPPLWLLYLVAFLLGTVETLADTAYGPLVADTVPADLLGRANARLYLAFSVNNQLVGPSLGALLFALGTAVPFGLTAVACGLGALVLLRGPARQDTPRNPLRATTIRADIRDGLRWLWRHPGLRILAICIFVMNLAGVGTFAIWVLYGTGHLGLTDAQYGLFVSTGAVGGIAGAWTYGRLEKHVGQTALLRAGLVVEALTYLALALTSNPWVAGATMAVFGLHAIVWGTVATTARQRATPSELLGRVGSVYQLASVCGSVLGALLGGFLATRFGLLVPFWLAFVLVAVLVPIAWPGLASVGRAVRAGEPVQQ